MAPTNNRSSLRTFVFGGMLLVGVLLVVGLVAGSLFDFGMPFTKSTEDHSPPIILNEVRDLAEFRAAEAEFEVIVDRETDIKWVPSFVAGERVQFVAVGSVDATVDSSALNDESVIYDAETDTATIVLPAPIVGKPVVDLDRSGVMNRDRGVLDRLGGLFVDNPTEEISLIQEAEDKMAAAVGQTDLLARAQENTTEMLTGLIEALGVDNVRVIYEQTVTPLG